LGKGISCVRLASEVEMLESSMLVGVMADSHDNVPMIRRAIELFAKEGAEVVLHAGDFVAPFSAKEVMEFPGKVIAVFGNNDGETEGLRKVVGDIERPPRRLELGGLEWLLVHDRDAVAAKELEGVDVLVFAHSHEPMVEGGGMLAVNPGECGAWLTGESTVALFDTEKREAKIRKL
jgi:putative phosphoesterase